jgi:glucose/arabinose dehydrogenase
MKPPNFLFLLLLIIMLMACQSDAEKETGFATEIASAVPSEETGVLTIAPVTVNSTRTTPHPTFTNMPAAVVSPPPDQAQEEPAPTIDSTPTPLPSGRPAEKLDLTLLLDGLNEPLYLTHAGDERLFIVEKGGMIQLLAEGQLNSLPFLDIRDRIASSGYEQGLLSVAFHPNYTLNGYFYVNYTDLSGATIIARYQREATNPNRADPDSEQILMRMPQPYVNHNGGQLQFGPDDYLYIAMGDGGSAGDPEQRGQDPTVYLGKLLRIDVDSDDPYSLPEDNPYVGMSSVRNEIWARGLRNPWRFSFDRQTGDLLLADVGQSLWEEINFQPAASQGGENYGWDIMEGNHCFSESNCDLSGLTLPIGEYAHEAGHCSVTGGYVYRGNAAPEMNGNYVFGDYCSGFIWRLFPSSDGTWSLAQIADTELFIASFGEDVSGELYVLDLIGGALYTIALQ